MTFEKNLSFIRHGDTAENPRQRALARAILPAESVNFAGKQFPIYLLERDNTPVMLMNIPAFEHKKRTTAQESA